MSPDARGTESKVHVWSLLAAALVVMAITTVLVVRWQGEADRAQGAD